MVTETGYTTMSRTPTAHEHGSSTLGMLSVAAAVLSIGMLSFASSRELAWVPSVPAIIFAVVALSLGAGRKRYAATGILLGWFGFSFSFAMMLWG